MEKKILYIEYIEFTNSEYLALTGLKSKLKIIHEIKFMNKDKGWLIGFSNSLIDKIVDNYKKLKKENKNFGKNGHDLSVLSGGMSERLPIIKKILKHRGIMK